MGVALAAAYAVHAPAASAQVGDLDLRYMQLTNSGPTAGLQQGPVYSDCPLAPKGYAMGGGIRVSGGHREQYANSLYPDVDPSNPAGGIDGWSTVADNPGAGPEYSVGADVVCSEVVVPTYPASADFNPPGKRSARAVECPDGARVVGGGVDASGTFGEQRIAASAPRDFDGDGKPDDGWRVQMDNIGSDPESFTVLAVCAEASAVPDLVYRSRTFTADGRQRSKGRAPCPGGTHEVGGGTATKGPFRSTWLVTTAPSSNPAFPPTENEGWRAKLDNRSATDRPFTVHAICHP